MKKLLIVVGAGASLDFGMPSVKKIDELFQAWAIDLQKLINQPSGSLYSFVKEKLHEYAIENNLNRIAEIINFENIIFTIQNLSYILRDKEWKHYNAILNPFIKIQDLPDVEGYRGGQKANGDDFANLHSHLVDQLLAYFRGICRSVRETKKQELAQLHHFFSFLKTEFDLGFINLNYDNLILTALPGLETGFDPDTGIFNRKRIYSKKWNFCYHLHGSVHFDMKGNGVNMHSIFWNNDLNAQLAQNSSGRNNNYTAEGISHLNSCIITGLDKGNQILREPFGTYFMRMDELIYEADGILFIGYGFRDTYLNRLFPFIREDSKTRKVVVIDYCSNGEDGLSFRHDTWSFGLYQTIPFNGREMDWGEPHDANYYKSRRKMQCSSNPRYPLAVSYNGLMEVCSRPENIISELI